MFLEFKCDKTKKVALFNPAHIAVVETVGELAIRVIYDKSEWRFTYESGERRDAAIKSQGKRCG